MPFDSKELRKEFHDTDLWMPDDPINVLAFNNVPKNLIQLLEQEKGELRLISSVDEISPHLEDSNLRFIAGRSELKINGDDIKRAKSLAMIAKCCIGTDGLNFAMAAEKGVMIVNSRQAKNSVAEMAVEFALGITRNTIGSIIETCVEIPEGKLKKSSDGRHELASMSVGIVGAGQIGQLTAEKIAPLAKEVLFYDDGPNAEEKIGSRGTKIETLDELLERSDLIIIHADDTDHQGFQNKDLITAKRLENKGVFGVINLARGHIATTVEMVKAIEAGYIQRARTDVFLPKEEAEKQWDCPIPREMVMSGRFVGTAHIGASTEQVQENIGRDIADKWRRFREYRDMSFGQNFRSDNFNRPYAPRSIVFQHSTQKGTAGILGDALGAASINAEAFTLKDMIATPSKDKRIELPIGVTRIDTSDTLNETSIGALLAELKRSNRLILGRLTVIDRS